jgi:SAM-dependent methyltransferase
MNTAPNYYERNYRRFLPKDLRAPILDIGCGQGEFVRFLDQAGYERLTAVDRDDRLRAALQDLPRVTARVAEVGAGNLPRQRGGWALIIAKQMIYYFGRDEAPAFVQALAEALAADGRLVVEIFNGALLSSPFMEAKDPGIRTSYSELGLKRLLEQNGLIVERLAGADLPHRGFKGFVYAMAQALWFRLYRLLLILERGVDDELPRIGCKTIIAVARRA